MSTFWDWVGADNSNAFFCETIKNDRETQEKEIELPAGVILEKGKGIAKTQSQALGHAFCRRNNNQCQLLANHVLFTNENNVLKFDKLYVITTQRDFFGFFFVFFFYIARTTKQNV